MRDYALNRAAAAEATGSLSLLWGLLRNWRARRAVSRLDQLDDHLLRDIGVTRDELERLSRLPLTADVQWERERLERLR